MTTNCLTYKKYALIVSLLCCTFVGQASAADPWSSLVAINMDDKSAAKEKLEALLLEHPGFYPAHFNLGTVLMDSDRDQATSHLETATASPSPELQHDAWYNLSLARFGQGRLEDALAAAAKAVALQPDNKNTIALRDELRRVALIRANEARLKAEAEAKKLKLTSTTLPDGHVGEAYNQQLTARGGAGNYRFALGAPPPATSTASGTTQTTPPTPPPAIALPPGMTLEADGRLHGTPQAPGRHELPIVLNDKADANVFGTVTWVIQPAPAITTITLPEAIIGSPYEATIESIGLQQPNWTVTGLLPGLHAAETPGPKLLISGIPTASGTVTVQVRADDGERSASSALPLTASDTFAPDMAVLPAATAWAAYEQAVGVRGKPQTYTWSSPGAGGLTVDKNGRVHGTPQQAGNVELPVIISAADGRSRNHIITIPVNPPPVIDESTPISLHVGEPINRPLKVTGGTPPYVWSVAQGALPQGLRLDPDGTVRGAASEVAEVQVGIALEDKWHARTKSDVTFSITERPKDDQQQDQQQQQDEKQEQQQQNQQQQQDQKQNQQQANNEKSPEQQNQQQDQKQQQNQQQDQQQQAQQDQQQQNNNAEQKGDDQQNNKQTAEQQAQQAQQAEEQAAQRAQVLNQAAADRWLDSLPKEDRDVLRYQLLDGGQLKPRKDGKTW